MSDPRLLQYLIGLAQDPVRAIEFREDPDAALAAANLSSEQRDVLKSRDPSRIRAALADRPAEDDLLFLSWLGSIADEPDAEP
jgi:hypothetical protein